MDASAFLSTCAQVIPALVIALLVEDRLYSAAGRSANHPETGTRARRRQLITLNFGMIVAVIGEFAALMGLLIGGPLWTQITTLTSLAILALVLVLPLVASLREELALGPGLSGHAMKLVPVLAVIATGAAAIAGFLLMLRSQ